MVDWRVCAVVEMTAAAVVIAAAADDVVAKAVVVSVETTRWLKDIGRALEE